MFGIFLFEMKSDRSDLEKLIDKADLGQEEIGAVLDLSVPAVSNKIAGRRPWLQTEINKVLALLSARLRRRVRYEEAFRDGRPEPLTAGKR